MWSFLVCFKVHSVNDDGVKLCSCSKCKDRLFDRLNYKNYSPQCFYEGSISHTKTRLFTLEPDFYVL